MEHLCVPSSTIPSSSQHNCSCFCVPKPSLPIARFGVGTLSAASVLFSCPRLPCRRGMRWGCRGMGQRRKRWSTRLRASMSETPYDVLGVSSSATPQEIKRAYRRLALKYHPDVNKEVNAQEKFMRIKHAYNTLVNRNQRSDYSTSTSERNRSWKDQEEEDFYGFGDFFRDLQREFQNWEASINSKEKPKSLWEELADIGEEFVEFLEKELSITDMNIEEDGGMASNRSSNEKNGRNKQRENMKRETSSIEDNIDEIEATLAKLKRELGL